MAEVLILTERELRAAVDLGPAVVDAMERAFAMLARGGVVMPPILSMRIAERHGEVDVKTAYVPGLEAFAVKVSPGFFDNPERGLASLNGLMILLDAETGIVRAVLLDNGYLTDVRTAAAGALAARLLAPEDVTTAGVVGAGRQAELQVRALKLVRSFSQLVVWARDPAKGAAFAGRMGRALGIPARVAASPQELVGASDVVVTATPARTPLIDAACLHPRLHITAVGSDAADKNELAPEVLARAGRFVCDRHSQSAAVGELRSALAAGLQVAVDELGEICAGRKPGRRSEDEITVCDLTGTGLQDTAIAVQAWRTARERGLGTVIAS